MRILVLGSTGLIGSVVVRALRAAGHTVTALARDVDNARRANPRVAWMAADLATLTAPECWAALLAKVDADAIVNCAGALQDGARDDVAGVQSLAMQALYPAAERARVARLVQISAIRARLDADTAFMRTKAEADAALRASGLIWTILKPGLVLAPQAYGGTALLRALAAVPMLVPLTMPDRPVQTVHVDDVARAVLAALAGEVPARRDYDLVEPTPQPLAEVVSAFRGWLGLAAARQVVVPGWTGGLLARVADGLGWLGWRSPLRSTAMAEIAAGVTGDPEPWRLASGWAPRALEDSLSGMPATVQERWFARMFLVKPVAILTLAGFWVATGLITLAAPEAAARVLSNRGLEPSVATAIAVGGAIVDVGLGVAVLVRSCLVRAAQGMIAVSLAYLAGGTLVAPDLWADPLGPLVKVVPAMALAIVVLAVAEDR